MLQDNFQSTQAPQRCALDRGEDSTCKPPRDGPNLILATSSRRGVAPAEHGTYMRSLASTIKKTWARAREFGTCRAVKTMQFAMLWTPSGHDARIRASCQCALDTSGRQCRLTCTHPSFRPSYWYSTTLLALLILFGLPPFSCHLK